MRAYEKGDRLYFAHKASMTCNLLGVVSKFTLYDELPKGCKCADFHRVSVEVVKTKKEMTVMKSKMRRKRAAMAARGRNGEGA